MPYNANNDYRTSKGNVAPDYHWSGTDDTYNDRDQIKRVVERDFSPAQVVRPATRKYNCHAYAHAGSHAWFDEITKFLEDDYYPFTPGTLLVNDICVYVKSGQITHSAKIVQLNGNQIVNLRSKWGAWPEVIHAPNNVPNVYGSIVYYLRKRSRLVEDNPDFFTSDAMENIYDLIEELQSEEARMSLQLASTSNVAIAIAREQPALVGLLLHGDDAVAPLSEYLASDSSPHEARSLCALALSSIPTEAARAAFVGYASQALTRDEGDNLFLARISLEFAERQNVDGNNPIKAARNAIEGFIK